MDSVLNSDVDCFLHVLLAFESISPKQFFVLSVFCILPHSSVTTEPVFLLKVICFSRCIQDLVLKICTLLPDAYPNAWFFLVAFLRVTPKLCENATELNQLFSPKTSGMTGSPLLLQLQANLLGCDVAKPAMKEVSSVFFFIFLRGFPMGA